MLDTFFKSYFWIFRLGVVFAAGYLVARTVNVFIAEALRVPPSEIAAGPKKAPVRARRAAPTKAGALTVAFLERNLFKAEREDIIAKQEQEKQEAAGAESNDGPLVIDDDNCKASSLGAKLLATFVAEGTPDASVAVFEATKKGGDTVALRPGDPVLDTTAELLFVDFRKAYIKNNGRCESLSLEKQKATARPTPARPSARRGGNNKDGLGKGVTKTGANEWTIPKEEIDNVLSNLNKVATQARIVPSFHNGKANGFKLFSIRPNSLYSKIGIQNGDIVQRINGYEMNSPDKALEIYTKLKDAQTITVDLVRRGKSKTLSYNIQ